MFVGLLTAAKAKDGNLLVARGPDRSETGAETPIPFVLKGGVYETGVELPSVLVTDVCDERRGADGGGGVVG